MLGEPWSFGCAELVIRLLDLPVLALPDADMGGTDGFLFLLGARPGQIGLNILINLDILETEHIGLDAPADR
jgi:hypothetical protein